MICEVSVALVDGGHELLLRLGQLLFSGGAPTLANLLLHIHLGIIFARLSLDLFKVGLNNEPQENCLSFQEET